MRGPYREPPKSLRLEQPLTLRQEQLARAAAVLGAALVLEGADFLVLVLVPSWPPSKWLAWVTSAIRILAPTLALVGAVLWRRGAESRAERWLAILAASGGVAFLACVGSSLRLGPIWLIGAEYAESVATFCTLGLLALASRGSVRSIASVLTLCFSGAWITVWANNELMLLGLRAQELLWPLGVIAAVVLSAGGLWFAVRASLVPLRQLEFHVPAAFPHRLRARVLTFGDGRVHVAVSGRGEVRYADLTDALDALHADGFVDAEGHVEGV